MPVGFALRRLALSGVAAAAMMSAAGPALAFTPEQARGHLQRAQQYLDDGNVNAATIEARNAVQADPRNANAHLLLARLLLQAGRHVEAARSAQEAFRVDQESPGPRLLLADILMELGDFAAAEAELSQARTLGASVEETALAMALAMAGQQDLPGAIEEISRSGLPEVAVAMRPYFDGLAALRRNQIEEAEALLVEAAEQAPDQLEPRQALARLYLTQGRLGEAELRADEAIAIAPTRSNAYFLKGLVDRAQGELDAAIANFKTAMDQGIRTQASQAAMVERAQLLLATGRDEEAIDQIDTIYKISPDNPLAHYLSAVLAVREGDLEAAEDKINEIGGRLTNFPQANLLEGYMAFRRGNFTEAESKLNAVLQARPGLESARLLLAGVRVRSGDMDRVLTVLDPLLRGKDIEEIEPRTAALAGLAYLRKGNFDEATRYLESAITAFPDNESLLSQVALGRLALGDTDSALSQLQLLVDEGDNPLRSGLLLALVQRRLGRTEEAIESARGVIEAAPDLALGYNLLGSILLGRGDLEEARSQFEAALERDSDFAPARTNLAEVALRNGDLRTAEQLYRRVLSDQPDNLLARLNLAQIKMQQGESAEGLNLYADALVDQPNSLQVRLLYARALAQSGDIDRAISLMETARRDRPNEAVVMRTLGNLFMAKDDYDRAIPEFERLARLNPGNPVNHIQYAQALRRAGDLQQAEIALFRARDRIEGEGNPQEALVLQELTALAQQQRDYGEGVAYWLEGQRLFGAERFNYLTMGQLLFGAERYEDALEAFTKAREQEDLFAARAGQFESLRALGRPEDAFQILEDWVAGVDDDFTARSLLANGYLAIENHEEAARHYRELARSDRANELVFNNLAWSLYKLGDPQAVEFAERAMRLAPNNPAVVDTLAWILLQNGVQEDRALNLLQTAADAAPNSYEIQYHLAYALQANGRTEAAINKLQELADKPGNYPQRGDVVALLRKLQG